MITFGKTKQKHEVIDSTPVFCDGVNIGEIISTAIGHQYDEKPGFTIHKTVYNTLDECKAALI